MAAEHMETMPQTVPSALGFGSSLYDFSSVSFAADFDLSLLPSGADCEVPYSPQSQLHLLSLYCDQTSPMFPGALDDFYKPPAAADSPKLVKEEPYQSGGWEGSPIGSTYSSPHYCPPSPLSPDPAVARIKQEITLDLEEILQSPEYLENIYFSQEKTDQAGIRAQESKFLQDIFQREKKDNGIRAQEAEYQEGSIIRNILEREPVERKPQPDHRLLREVLKDTSFQKRYNLMPFEIGGVGPAFKSEVKMEACETDNGVPTAAKGEASASASGVCGVDIAQDGIEPMLSLAIEQLKEDLNHTCNVLGIATDPAQWTSEDAKGWLVFNLQQFGLPAAAVDRFHDMAGPQLTQLTEDEFQQRAPQGGSLLHAQLEIWKAACGGPPIGSPPIGSPPSALMMDTATQSSSSCGDASEDEEDEEMGMTGMMGMGGADSPPPPHLLASASAAASPSAGGAAKGQGGRGGSHIHLWQFLKELLASPQANGACIRWLDRTTGVFKIEDSVRVARLWGQRKNRPAMNYDKLSRSIRQYYKKGIMKKTERSQRLVYQFCHPYCL